MRRTGGVAALWGWLSLVYPDDEVPWGYMCQNAHMVRPRLDVQQRRYN